MYRLRIIAVSYGIEILRVSGLRYAKIPIRQDTVRYTYDTPDTVMGKKYPDTWGKTNCFRCARAFGPSCEPSCVNGACRCVSFRVCAMARAARMRNHRVSLSRGLTSLYVSDGFDWCTCPPPLRTLLVLRISLRLWVASFGWLERRL